MSVSKRIDRWRNLYQSSSEVTKGLYIIDYPFPENPQPILCKENKTERIDWAKRLYERQIQNIEEYDDDLIPYLYVATGTEIFAEAFGCKVVYPENNMPFALPMVFDADQARKLKVPKLEDTSLMLLFDMADELQKYAGKEAVFKHVDIQCPMDITALIWGKEEYFISMIESPEIIKETAEKVKELMISFFDEWYRRYGCTYVAHFPDYYMETGITMSVDEVGSISPEMFELFFKDEINDFSHRYHGIGVHCCADSEAQWENFRKIDDLVLINFVRRRGSIENALNFFKDVCVQYHNVMDESAYFISQPDLEKLPQGMRGVFPVTVSSLEEAKRVSEQYAKAFGR